MTGSEKERLIRAEEVFKMTDWRHRIEDFSKTYRDASEEDLKMFRIEYELTVLGTFNGLSEDNYNALYWSGLRYQFHTEKIEERLRILRNRAQKFAEINANPNSTKRYGPVDLIEVDQKIQQLSKKDLERTITEDERWKLMALLS